MILCGSCPWRRDADLDREMAESFIEILGKVPEQKCSQYDQICAGWLQFARNCNLHIVLKDEKICSQISAMERDDEDVFGSFQEFLRYHRGEHFGSEDWLRSRRAIFEKPPHTFDEDTGQGNLF